MCIMYTYTHVHTYTFSRIDGYTDISRQPAAASKGEDNDMTTTADTGRDSNRYIYVHMDR